MIKLLIALAFAFRILFAGSDNDMKGSARRALRATSIVQRSGQYDSASRRSFSNSISRRADFTHAIVGGGAVGLAIARQLQGRDGASTVLIEKHGTVGTETSSRNSEVIHAGIYYGKGTLKTELCLRGKHLIYELCDKYSIPYRNCGKWIVAQDDFQREQLQK